MLNVATGGRLAATGANNSDLRLSALQLQNVDWAGGYKSSNERGQFVSAVMSGIQEYGLDWLLVAGVTHELYSAGEPRSSGRPG